MKISRVFIRLCEAVNDPKKDYSTFILQGGTSSTKTFSTLQLFYVLASQYKIHQTFSVVSESVPHLRRGVIRDWMNILGEDYDPETHNASEEVFHVGNSIVEFFAIDHPDKARGGRRDYLFINECNRISKETRDHLRLRTSKKEFLDFNPSAEFWAHELVSMPNVWFDISTYNDARDSNGAWLIPKTTVEGIEALKTTNPNWWRIYGEGQIGRPEGLIMPPIYLIDALPEHLQTKCGLDFGFSNDPSVLLEAGEASDSLYVNQLFYGRGMTNQDIIKEMERKGVPKDYIVFADCAEPKSIQEIFNGGFKGIKPCTKGRDCFLTGIDHIRRYKKIYVTKNSVDVIKDYRNGMWEKDITGKYLNKAKRGWLHSIDALIYSLNDKLESRRGARGGSIAI